MIKKEAKTRLLRKGWTKEELDKAEEIVNEKEAHDKSGSLVHSNRILFWSVMFVIIIGNALIAFILIPMILVFTELAMSVFSLIVGLLAGLLFNFLVWDIEDNLQRRHHVIAILAIPTLAIVNLYGIVRISNAINDVFQITAVREDPLSIAAFYVVGFLIPYLFTLFYKKKIKRY